MLWHNWTYTYMRLTFAVSLVDNAFSSKYCCVPRQRAHWLTTAINSNRNGSPVRFHFLTAPAIEFKTVNNSISTVICIFSSFSVRSQNHSYKNSIVFRLARHLCSSTSLVCMYMYTYMYIHGYKYNINHFGYIVIF